MTLLTLLPIQIYVAVEAPSTGWVSFGISEAAGMRGADIMMGHVASDGKVFVGDYHATGNALPVKDGCQDWTVHLGEANAGSTLLVVSRPLVTEDSNDRPILLEGLTKTGLLFAYGGLGNKAKHDTDGHGHGHGRQLTTHDYVYHGANRVKVFVDLGTGADAGQVRDSIDAATAREKRERERERERLCVCVCVCV